MRRREAERRTSSQPNGYLDHNTARDGQVAVEPGVPDAAAVALHADLQTALLRPLRPRLHLIQRRHQRGDVWGGPEADCE